MKNNIIFVCLVTLVGYGCVSEEGTGDNLSPEERTLLAKRYCNVCENGGQITNPDKKFVMENPQTGESHDWTCGFLAESLADVLANGGAPGESFYCKVGQLWAKKECTCSGKPLPEKDNNIHSANPACDLCLKPEFDYKFVPEILADKMAPTGIAGNMPCGGLYKAAALGIFTAENCVKVRNSAGPVCCNIPPINDPPPQKEDDIEDDPIDDTPSQECGQSGPAPGKGFVVTEKTGGKIHAVYGETPSKYCHVIDPGELKLIGIKQGWGSHSEKWTFDELDCNRDDIGFCPWPSGMLIRNNAIYYIKDATPTREGTVCWVKNGEQVKNFGGFTSVWKPGVPDNQLKFEFGTSNGLVYGDRIPPCTNDGKPAW